MLDSLVEEIASLQNSNTDDVLFGNYSSTRYHKLLPIKRNEDNVYFVAWINQLLKRNLHLLPDHQLERVKGMISKGEQSINNYRNRYGQKTYNFYRPDAWFPNGNILSRWVSFQPTDDTDDTSIALRGKEHDHEYAYEIKRIFSSHSNGRKGRSIKRLPKRYRHLPFYSTWIGSDRIYVDTDIVILSNILMFVAQYDLSFTKEDLACIEIIRTSIINGDYLKKDWSLCAWYPIKSTILYSLADLIAEDYYPSLAELRTQVIIDTQRMMKSETNVVGRLLLENALLKLGCLDFNIHERTEISSVLKESKEFSFGVIPLLHPFNGSSFQYLSRYSLFRLFYRCDAQCLAILLENQLLKEKVVKGYEVSTDEHSETQKEEQDSISRILSHSN